MEAAAAELGSTRCACQALINALSYALAPLPAPRICLRASSQVLRDGDGDPPTQGSAGEEGIEGMQEGNRGMQEGIGGMQEGVRGDAGGDQGGMQEGTCPLQGSPR